MKIWPNEACDRHIPKREKHSRAMHKQEFQKAQQKRGVAKGRSEEPSRC